MMEKSIANMPGHLLRRCHQIGVAIFLEECAAFKLTPLQFAILQTLQSNGPLDQVSLGGITAMDRTSIAMMVRKLEQRGLLQRDRSQQDQRAKIVSLTSRGAELVREVLPAVSKAQQRILEPLDAQESKRLLGLLGKLAEGNNASSRAPQKIHALSGRAGDLRSKTLGITDQGSSD